jgi:TolB-like protein/Flp pilus assembly protein TadD
MSSDPEQEYLSDGIAEELLDALARVDALKVAARTSAFSFKGKPVDVREVGHKLNVATVLEGSVRKSGKRLRITAQLIDVETGYHLWSDTYERELTDIFAIQDDITSRIVSALRFSSGLIRRCQSRLDKSIRRPRSFCVVASTDQRSPGSRQPGCCRRPLAAGLRSRVPGWPTSISVSTTTACCRRKLSAGARPRGLELDDKSDAAHTALSHLLLNEWEWSSAEQHFRRAIELDPNYTLAQHWYALCLTALGRTDEAVKAMERARQLDPLSVRINADLGMAYLVAGMREESVAQEGRALELAPGAPGPRWIRGMALEQLGQFDDAELDIKAAFDAWSGDPAIKGTLGHLYAISGRQAKARALLTELTSQKDLSEIAFFAALICAGLNDTDAALTGTTCGRRRSGSVLPEGRPASDDVRAGFAS